MVATKSYRLPTLQTPGRVTAIAPANHPALANEMDDQSTNFAVAKAKRSQNFYKVQGARFQAIREFWIAAKANVESQVARLNHAGAVQQKTVTELGLVAGQYKITEANSNVTLAQISASKTADSVRVAEADRSIAQERGIVSLNSAKFEVDLSASALAQKMQIEGLRGNQLSLGGSPVQFQKTVNPITINIAQSSDDRASGRSIGGK